MPNKEKPTHVAIIPDGNRRWARAHALAIKEGYAHGVQKFREIIEEAFRAEIPYITFWAASEDNLLKRTKREVMLLVALLKRELKRKELAEMLETQRVRICFVGRWNEILRDSSLLKTIRAVEAGTAQYGERRLTVLFGYDGRREMLEAVQNIQEKKVDEAALSKSLWTGDLPPVDLVIRTGEEHEQWSHWSSGFMMWQTANSEFYFTKTFWPAFTPQELANAFENYAQRARKLGV